LNMCAWIC